MTTGAMKSAQEPQLPLKMPACQRSKATGSTVSSYLIPSRTSLGAISTINTLAVINTVLRQPMARKGSGPTQSGGRCSAGYQRSPFFSCHFVPVLTPKMVAGLCLAMWERRTNWQGRGRRRRGLWDWGGSLLFSFFYSQCIAVRFPRPRKERRRDRSMIVRLLPYMLPAHRRNSPLCGQRLAHTNMLERKNKVFLQCGREAGHPVMVCWCKRVIYISLMYAAHIRTHTCAHAWRHTHKQPTQPFSWYGLPLSMQMTFIMQMHTNQNQPSENPSWEKTPEKNKIKWIRGKMWEKKKRRVWKCAWRKYSVRNMWEKNFNLRL